MRFSVLASFALAVVFVKADQPEKPTNRTVPQVCQPGETKIEDCHRCWCLNGGVGWICEIKPIQLCGTDNPCEPGSSWNIQCNDCTCGPDGKTETCTRKGCVLRSFLPQNFMNNSQQVPEQSQTNSFLNTTRVLPQQPHQPDQLNNSHQVLQKQDHSVVSNNSYQVPELTITPIWNNTQEMSQQPPQQLNITLVWKTFQGTPQQPHPSLVSNNSHQVVQQPNRIIDADKSHGRPPLPYHSYRRPPPYPRPPHWHSVDGKDATILESSPYAHLPAKDRPCVPGERFNEECNTCTCGSDGMSATCTRYICRPKLRCGVKSGNHRTRGRCRLGQPVRRRCETCTCGLRGSLINCKKSPCKRWNRGRVSGDHE